MKTNETNHKRLYEILSVLRRNEIAKGVDPEKLAKILEELGPTYIKLGQILSTRGDVLTPEYAEALKKLQSQVAPMAYEEVAKQIEEAYGQSVGEVFAWVDKNPLGSASIAQTHRARFLDGTQVVVKVQRPLIYDRMRQDIALLKKGCRLLKYSPVKGLVDFQAVLDELWKVLQEEIDFLKEATNLERFRQLNKDIVYVTCPKPYREYTTQSILVMEYINGLSFADPDQLMREGYDLEEIVRKLASNYIKQVIEDGFFHADPHPGNLMVTGGKIAFLDMGMMGELSEKERKLLARAVGAVLQQNVSDCVDVVLGLGIFHRKPDRRALHQDIEEMLDKYGTQDLGSLKIREIFEDGIRIMNENGVEVPSSLTMLMRGLGTLEGVVTVLSPKVNVMELLGAYAASSLIENLDLRENGRYAILGLWKLAALPQLIHGMLDGVQKGETYIGLEHHATDDLKDFLREITDKTGAVIVGSALFIAAGVAWRSTFSIIMFTMGCIVMAVSYFKYKR